ncbi:hypothetical protein [Nonomuraea guangzhouensis]|uniref:Uncharacterized protein n=1 Tax=Nonomuraea guangzhouensis TaxID=1291555 RepID=A0ABW4FXY1_9ACTN|nr:hypothetical protein [Nonomuraea guangzhouensis]
MTTFLIRWSIVESPSLKNEQRFGGKQRIDFRLISVTVDKAPENRKRYLESNLSAQLTAHMMATQKAINGGRMKICRSLDGVSLEAH